MRYRRSKTKGGTFFFTIVTYQRRKIFNDDLTASQFMNAIKQIKNKHPFKMIGYVLLPDHFHCIWTLPENDNDFSMRWRLIKSCFTRLYLPNSKISLTPSRKNKKEQSIWQRRFWEHEIRSEEELAKYLDYIHYNPIKHHYVDGASQWKYSSFQHYVNKQIYLPDWGSSEQPFLSNFNVNE